MSETHPIRDKIIAGVATGIILAILSSIWPPARRFLGWVWSILGIGVTVPVWAFVVGVAIVLGIAAARRLWRVPDHDTLDSGAERLPRAGVDEDNQFAEDGRTYPQEETDQEIDVSGLERDVLKRIAKADDAPLYMNTL